MGVEDAPGAAAQSAEGLDGVSLGRAPWRNANGERSFWSWGMYLKLGGTYYVGTSQHARRGPFLLLLQVEKPTISETCSPDNTYAVVRQVALSQCGHFMMGRVRLGAEYHAVSGTYGNDGLPMTVAVLPQDAVKLPCELYNAWSNGGGHNGAGSEATAMREWALKEFKVKP